MTSYDEVISATPGDRAGVYHGFIPEDWGLGHALHGGVLMSLACATMSKALKETGAHADPLVLSSFFLSAADPGPFELRTEIVRTGRRMSTAQVSVVQKEGPNRGQERVRAVATFGDLAAARPLHRTSPPPAMPDPDECLAPHRPLPDKPAQWPFLQHLDLRIDPATAAWQEGRPSGQGEMRAWIRRASGLPVDAFALPFLLDAMPPVAFDLGINGWAPTLEMTTHIRALPEPGWLRMRIRGENLTEGFLEEDAQIWDSTGRLVAQSRQLAGVRLS